ncbi:MAG: 1-deoxy-D-xylulose-5-phosphate synthase [Bacteroidetes bacterium]|nr:1-deoxy-D-xylulose-5-phosphate synthase [Bacteroidota bacterium]
MTALQGEILSRVNNPLDLRLIDVEALPQLCEEIRSFIIDVISINPGHLGASLGVVELSVALHFSYNTPYDRLIWDVGHQAYTHKILTGRKDVFHLNRKSNGISGFPKISESEYDAFGVGHSSTSISAAFGMAIASELKEDNNNRQHIAVIGDGSITGGMAMEALNNAGVSKSNLLIILNDNGIAIDKNVGALKDYLVDIATSRTYNRLKNFLWRVLGKATAKYGPNHQRIAQQIENAIKGSILRRSNLFESFGFRYFGPVDGHDVKRMVGLFKDLQNIPGPKLLHIITKKGKGFKQAEKNQTRFHAPGVFDKKTGKIIEKNCPQKQAPKYQTVFGRTIIELAEQNEKIVGITPAMPTGCSLNLMMEKMPDRVFDVGIAEQHAVTFSAGLATQGMIPFCNVYSTFMQRAYDQVIHDVALQNQHVVICLDRGGLVGEDGATHHGAYDLSYFRSIPNMIVSAPMNEEELRNLMYTAQLKKHGAFSIRYPRGRGVMPEWKTSFKKLEIGIGRKIAEGDKLAIITIGHIGNYAIEVCEKLLAEGIKIGHYDIRFLKPIDENLLHEIFKHYQHIITVEDGTIIGGLGSAVLEFMADNNYQAKVKRLGIPDKFIEQGSIEELHKECGFDKAGIEKTVRRSLLE